MKPIQIYKPSNLQTIVFGVSFLLIILVTVLLSYVTFSSNSRIDDNGKTLTVNAFFILIALMISCAFILFRHINKPKFSLFENGIKINNGDIISFETITDVYLFLSGKNIGNNYNNLAFRTYENESWNIISANYSGNINIFLDLYCTTKVLFLEKELEEKKSTNFHYIPKNKINAFAIGANSFVKNLKTETIVVSDKHIIINGKAYEYQSLKPLYLNNNKFEIKTLNEQILLSFTYLNMMSFDVFRKIYNQRTTK